MKTFILTLLFSSSSAIELSKHHIQDTTNLELNTQSFGDTISDANSELEKLVGGDEADPDW